MTSQHSSRVALVTGAASGIGRCVAESLALGRGARVYVLDKDEEAAAAVVQGINESGGHAITLVVDLADGPGLRQALPSLTTAFGAPDIVVNNAGMAAMVPAAECSLDHWQATMAVNVTAPMLLMQHALPHMRQAGWGRIVNIASISGLRAGTGRMAYGTSKAALMAMTRQFAIEVAEWGITATRDRSTPMRHQSYTLTPIRITNAPPRTRPYKLTDGAGLYLVVSPGGTKAWRYQYRYASARCDVGIGTFPEIGIADARDQHQRYRSMLERGLDPAVARRQQVSERRDLSSMSRRRADEFEAFSKRWVDERMTTRSATYRAQILSRLERFVWPLIGTKPLGSVRPVDVLRVIEALTLTPNTAEGVRVIIQQIYNYAIQKLIVEVNPALPLRGVVQVPPARHYRHLREAELGAFWCAVERQSARFVTIAAAKLLAYSMCRKSDVLRAQWAEFDLERAVWEIPAVRMKMKRPHRVYLPRQAVELLRLLRAVTGIAESYVFPSLCRRSVPIADVTLNHLFKRLDFGVDDFAPHGLRATDATLLREHGFSRDVVELLLAHKERNPTTAAYHHHELAEERRRALQYLSDQIHHLAEVHRRRLPSSEISVACTQREPANC